MIAMVTTVIWIPLPAELEIPECFQTCVAEALELGDFRRREMTVVMEVS